MGPSPSCSEGLLSAEAESILVPLQCNIKVYLQVKLDKSEKLILQPFVSLKHASLSIASLRRVLCHYLKAQMHEASKRETNQHHVLPDMVTPCNERSWFSLGSVISEPKKLPFVAQLKLQTL